MLKMVLKLECEEIAHFSLAAIPKPAFPQANGLKLLAQNKVSRFSQVSPLSPSAPAILETVESRAHTAPLRGPRARQERAISYENGKRGPGWEDRVGPGGKARDRELPPLLAGPPV
jgi:hypothetical protein